MGLQLEWLHGCFFRYLGLQLEVCRGLGGLQLDANTSGNKQGAIAFDSVFR